MARDYSQRAESERNHLFACCNTKASGVGKSGCRRISCGNLIKNHSMLISLLLLKRLLAMSIPTAQQAILYSSLC